ncbi:MAG TPA: chemotaxis protein CheB, partial [Vicinamibacterales bacterium]|nr:chemotaxis protein CheB [Vicinamibacterales bacterium]
MSESIERGKTVARDAPSLAVVALGASAGGIRALQEFFARVSRDGGTAYVVVLHLSPAHESQLAEVLQPITTMPVTQVTEPTPIEADRVYVIAPHTVLEVRGGLLTVSDMSAPEQRRGPIDAFFRSLAEAYGHQAVAVVLSGTGTDGSAGVKRIKECGGLVVAQDPEDAEYPDMPRHAIATGLVDVVLPTPEMPERLARFAHGLRRELADAPLIETLPVPDPIREVLSVLRVRTGHDFSNYKRATLQRRIARRMAVRNTPTMEEYALLVREIRDEPKLLMSDLLISVTSFFRDPAMWQALEQRIVPRVFLNKLSSDQVRVWVAGCATGEEAYSLAMVLAEHAASSIEGPSIQVFATDLDERAIAIARDGLYNEADVVDVPEERLKRFFHKEAEGYRIRRDLREFVLFATHNVLRDPPFSHLDLISCRNLLIYLNRAAQERVIETFHFALRPGRYLLVGGSESAEASNDLFVRIDPSAHVYESRTVTSRLALPVADIPLPARRSSLQVPERRTVERAWPADLHQRLLEQYAPPSVVVTEDHRILHMSERVGRYLAMRGGEPTRDLLALVRPELRPHVRTVLHQAAAGRSPVEARDIEVALDDGMRRI